MVNTTLDIHICGPLGLLFWPTFNRWPVRGLGLGLSGRVLRSGRSGEAAGNSRGAPWLRRIWGYCGKALVTDPANRMMIPIDDVAQIFWFKRSILCVHMCFLVVIYIYIHMYIHIAYILYLYPWIISPVYHVFPADQFKKPNFFLLHQSKPKLTPVLAVARASPNSQVQFLNDRDKLNKPNSQIGFIEPPSRSGRLILGMLLKMGYTSNEIAIFHRDNDQQNHWV